MKLFTIITLILISLSSLAQEPVPPVVNFQGGLICNPNPYKLVWAEEFDGDELNTERWLTHFPCGLNTPPLDACFSSRTHEADPSTNKEGQIYLDENISVSNGTLKLANKKENVSWMGQNEDYSSGMIYSNENFPDRMRVEARIKLPSASGLWPAFWLYGWSTEIDVFEAWYPANKSHYLSSSVHKWPEFAGNDAFTTKSDNRSSLPSLSSLQEDFHLYAVEYEDFFVTTYIDGIEFMRLPRYTHPTSGDDSNCYPPAGVYLQDQHFPIENNPLHIIINTAILGGDAHNPDFTIIDDIMEVDYVRVYKKNSLQGEWPGGQFLCDSDKLYIESVNCEESSFLLCSNLETGLHLENVEITNGNLFEIIEQPAINWETQPSWGIKFVLRGQEPFVRLVAVPDTQFHENCIRVERIELTSQNPIFAFKDLHPCYMEPIEFNIEEYLLPEPEILDFDYCEGIVSFSMPFDLSQTTIYDWTISDYGLMDQSTTTIHIEDNIATLNFLPWAFPETHTMQIKIHSNKTCPEEYLNFSVQIDWDPCFKEGEPNIILFRPNPVSKSGQDYFEIELENEDQGLLLISVVSMTTGITDFQTTCSQCTTLEVSTNKFEPDNYIVYIQNSNLEMLHEGQLLVIE